MEKLKLELKFLPDECQTCNEEWTIIEQLVEILKPFQHATEVMSGEKYQIITNIKNFKTYHDM